MDFDIKISPEPIDYEIALKMMQDRREKIINGTAKSLLWLLEHNDVYTAGRNANQNDLLDKKTKVIDVDRGGKFTYHGKGQRICYIIADLRKFNNGELDIRKFINAIENSIIDTLQHFGITSFADRENIGIWVQNGEKKEKIASIGIKIGQMVTTHGFALNVCTNLDKFSVIVPCGISDFGVCSVSSLGVNVDMHDIDKTLLLTIKQNLDL